jgi:hypothetical protein
MTEVDRAGGDVEEDDRRQEDIEQQGQRTPRRPRSTFGPAMLGTDADSDSDDDRSGCE